MPTHSPRERVLANLRSLEVLDPERLLPLPRELGEYIARLTPEDIERIREDVRELERLGLLPSKRP